MPHSVSLPDGRLVRFGLVKRNKFWTARFRNADGKETWLTTKETGRPRALEVAGPLVAEAYGFGKARTVQPMELEVAGHKVVLRAVSAGSFVSWEDAVKAATAAMIADNRRQTTINDYNDLARLVQTSFPETKGPGDITEEMAAAWKARRSGEVSPHSLAGDITALRSLWGKWFQAVCKVVKNNPWLSVDKPKLDKLDPRRLTDEEVAALVAWLGRRWDGWTLPSLYIRTKAFVGCRAEELAGLLTANLRDGRITFPGDAIKGRADGYFTLTDDLFRELKTTAGKTFVFEGFSEGLKRIYKKRNRPQYYLRVGEYTPDRLVGWIETQVEEYRRELGITDKKDPRYFKLHNLRGTAMSKARDAGVSLDDASIAFRCHPDTMRKHYVKQDKLDIADAVAAALQKKKD